MRLIQNTTLQGLGIPFLTPTGIWNAYLKPKDSILVPDSYQSVVLDTLLRRRMVKATKVVESVPTPVEPKKKK